MSNIDGSASSENGEGAGGVKARGVCGVVIDLEAETESVSAGVCQATHIIYLGAVEQRARASGISDDEGVLGEGAQGSAGVVEEFEGLVTGVNNGRCDLHVLQSIDIDIGG